VKGIHNRDWITGRKGELDNREKGRKGELDNREKGRNTLVEMLFSRSPC